MHRLPDFIRWETPEYHHEEKSSDWRTIVWIVAASAALASILLGNLIFGIFIVIATFALMSNALRPPETIECEASKKGISIGKTLYPYSSLEGFGIDEEALSFPRLVLKSQKTFMPHISAPLQHVDIELLREFLLKHIPDEGLTEPLGHKILEYFGF